MTDLIKLVEAGKKAETPKVFKPRSSKMGAYSSCDQRAAFDAAIELGLLTIDGLDDSSSPRASLGNLAHDILQTRLGVFANPRDPGKLEGDLANASQLFKGDMELAKMAASAAADMAAQHMPPSPDGKPWVCEEAFEIDTLTGHTDFRSADKTVIVDLKTTSMKPPHNRMHAAHFIQLINYFDLTGRTAKTGYILYVESMSGQWAMLSQAIDFTNDIVLSYVEAQAAYRRRLMDVPTLVKSAMPHLGVNCEKDYCPYTSICRDALIPGPGKLKYADDPSLPEVATFTL